MSWKGVKKSISRFPHQFKTRNDSEDVTKDEEYMGLEYEFKDITKNLDEFRIDVVMYRDNLTNLLRSQDSIATNLASVCGIELKEDGTGFIMDRLIKPDIKQALEDYVTAMSYCKQEMNSVIDELNQNLVHPLDQFQLISKTIHKTIIKREHKLIDYDRYRLSYFKYNTISYPTPSEEKNLERMKAQYEQASDDYERFNNMLKRDLLSFLNLTHQFLQPLFKEFHQLQTRLLGGIYGRLYELTQHHTKIFPTLSLPIQKGIEIRLIKRNVAGELDSLFTTPGQDEVTPWEGSPLNRPARSNTVSSPFSDPVMIITEPKNKRPPPPPPSQKKKEFVEALYELKGPEPGDLSFSVGDRIEVIEKSEKTEDWWKGRIRDQVGMFPANYVKPV